MTVARPARPPVMLTNVATKAVRDRWRGATVAMALVGLLLGLAMLAYQQIDTSFYDELPEAIRAVMGIPAGADPAALAYAVTFGLVGSLTLAGLGVSLGAAAAAGEERDGTLGLLLANPRSRRHVLLARSAAGAGLVLLGGGIALGSAHLAPALVGVEIGASDLLAMSIHLTLNALLWGALALAVGAVTGNRGAASGTSAGTMVVAYFLVGLLPLVRSGADLARLLPWYWFDGHDPLVNGLSVGYALLQVAATAILGVVAWWRVDERDLTGPHPHSVLRALAARLRRDRRVAVVLDRLTGRVHLRGVTAKTFSEGRVVVTLTAVVMFSMMGLLMGPMYVAIQGAVADLAADLPPALLAVAGGGDMTTPEGWYRLETFGLMAPVGTSLAAAMVGVRALAGEERSGTMGLLLANPVSRRRIVLAKAVAMVLHAAVVGAALFAGVVGGSLLADLGMSPAKIAAASLQATLLGVLFGSVALAAGAATGAVRRSWATTMLVGAAAYAGHVLLLLTPDLERWAVLTPFQWYLGNDPLLDGIDVAAVTRLVVASAVLVTAAAELFDRRDLRPG